MTGCVAWQDISFSLSCAEEECRPCALDLCVYALAVERRAAEKINSGVKCINMRMRACRVGG